MTNDTGEKVARAGNNGNVPPVDKQFGKPKGNTRNRKGRPKSFDALRKLAVKIAGETIPSPDGNDITRIEAMLRVLTSSKAPADRALFLAYAYGKPRESLDVTSGGEKIIVTLVREE